MHDLEADLNNEVSAKEEVMPQQAQALPPIPKVQDDAVQEFEAGLKPADQQLLEVNNMLVLIFCNKYALVSLDEAARKYA